MIRERSGIWRAIGLAIVLPVLGGAAGVPTLTLEIKDYVAMPITGALDGKGQTDGLLARVNSMREEPGGANRFFINDLNGRDGHTGLFHRFAFETGFANGLVSIQFDPDYRRNGTFFTVHIEDPALPASNLPDNARV